MTNGRSKDSKAMNEQFEQFRLQLGAQIKKIRKDKGWSLSHMVREHGFADTQWRKFERTGAMSMENLVRIAGLFEMSLSRLLDGLAEFPIKTVAEIASDSVGIKSTGKKSAKQAKKVERGT